jgi:hypothetical protein
MDFKTLNTLIPHALGEKLHVLSMSPYNAITLAMPGRHQKDTPILGGDFVVMVDDTDLGWVKHQFTHDDLFKDIEAKHAADPLTTYDFMKDYAKVILGADPVHFDWDDTEMAGIHPTTFLYAVQCLAVAEHRRYGQHEARGGGRFLPARFSSGIVEGLWTAADCARVQRRGRPGLDQLIKENGSPATLKELANV